MVYWHDALARSTSAPLTSTTKGSWLCASHRGPVINVSLAVHFPFWLWWGAGGGGEEGAGNRSHRGFFLGRLYSCCILAFSFSFNNHLLLSPLLLVSRHISYIIYSTITETAISLESGMALLWAAWFYSVNTSDNIRYPNCSARFYSVVSLELRVGLKSDIVHRFKCYFPPLVILNGKWHII